MRPSVARFSGIQSSPLWHQSCCLFDSHINNSESFFVLYFSPFPPHPSTELAFCWSRFLNCLSLGLSKRQIWSRESRTRQPEAEWGRGGLVGPLSMTAIMSWKLSLVPRQHSLPVSSLISPNTGEGWVCRKVRNSLHLAAGFRQV